MAIETIQIKRGLKANLPRLAEGELALAVDTDEVFIGTADGNIQALNPNLTTQVNTNTSNIQTNTTNIATNTTNIATNTSQLALTMSYPILSNEVGVVNKNYPYNDARRFGIFGNGKGTGGNITSGSNTLTIAGTSVTHNFIVGDTIIVQGAGVNGANLVSTVSAVTSTTITLATNASTTVTNVGVVNIDYSTQLQNFFNSYQSVLNIDRDTNINMANTPNAKLIFPVGVITTLSAVMTYAGLLHEGEFANVLGGTIFLQCNISQPFLKIFANATHNAGNGNNLFRHIAFKSSHIDDTQDNSPCVFFMNAWNNHSDTEFDHCTFQNTAGYSIQVGSKTTGSGASGSTTLTLADGSLFRTTGSQIGGSNIIVKGGGAGGTDLTTWIVSGGGTTTVTLHDALGTTISNVDIYAGDDNLNPLKITDCEFDVVRGGIEFRYNAGGMVWVQNTEAYQNIRGFVHANSSGVVSIEVRDSNLMGCGNPSNGNSAYRYAIYLNNTNAKDTGYLKMDNCEFGKVSSFGGSILVQNKRSVKISNCGLEDMDASDLAKFLFLINLDYIDVQGNRLISNTLASYTNSRIIAISCSTAPKFTKIKDNIINNTNATAISNFIQSDYQLPNAVIDNIYLGSATTALENNVLNSGVRNSGGNLNVVKYSTSAPTTGTWNQGDIIYNTAPTASGNIGWVCVAGGTPGTWKTFGVISA